MCCMLHVLKRSGIYPGYKAKKKWFHIFHCSPDYLLSNNHVNSIIVLKLDFSDEEVLAYYISFLKTLSFKLNKHTIHFFYNEHLRDFPLYTEAIKFFNHSESMVRIAVRTLTLNVYKGEGRLKCIILYIQVLAGVVGKEIFVHCDTVSQNKFVCVCVCVYAVTNNLPSQSLRMTLYHK